ncbi:MAG: hypothetical protein LKF42_05325 [Streptococcaceae bacterium]|jgi:hypothetical protein|nr:hypothetical protein [Streptococcaceae bacterium]MCH4176832.1 hypothetical protein [Streptococcaceae bacterium]
MMHLTRVLVEVVVPTINQSFDLYLPIGCQLAELFPELITAIIDLSSGVFVPNFPLIYLLDEEVQLSFNMIIDAQLNGARLLII